MVIGGIEKLSLIDFPGCLAAIVFTKSCNFRCHFCYNPMLVLANGEGENEYKEEDNSLLQEDNLLLFLEERFGKIDGLVISGGEPTLQKDLKDFILKVKKIGYKIKLDTNGTDPEMLKDLIDSKLIDYVAMDIKSSLDSYEKIVGVKTDLKKIKKSIKLLMSSGIDYEFRTTLVPGLHDLDDIEQMAKDISGAKKWFLQKFKSDTNLVNKSFQGLDSFSSQDIVSFMDKIKKHVPNCKIRE